MQGRSWGLVQKVRLGLRLQCRDSALIPNDDQTRAYARGMVQIGATMDLLDLDNNHLTVWRTRALEACCNNRVYLTHPQSHVTEATIFRFMQSDKAANPCLCVTLLH